MAKYDPTNRQIKRIVMKYQNTAMTDPHHKISILFILPNLQVGGAERVMVTLMNRLDRANFEQAFLSLSNEGPLKAQMNADTPLYSLEDRKPSLSALPALYKKIKEIKPDIVVSTMAHMNFSVLLLRPLFPKTAFVVREAALPSMIFKSHPKTSWAIKTAYRLLYPLATVVISPSKPIMQEFKALHLGLKNHAILYNPVDTTKVRGAAERGMAQAEPNIVHFVAAGQLYWPKGFDRLIENLASLQMEDRWHLTILGEGRDRDKLSQLIAAHKLDDRVTLAGFSANPWPLYAQADCFLLSSRTEGMPNVALEALATGTKVIGMREAGGITDIAALAKPGAVIIADDIGEFIQAMSIITPLNKTAPGPSLLPDEFQLEHVAKLFSEIIQKPLKIERK